MPSFIAFLAGNGRLSRPVCAMDYRIMPGSRMISNLHLTLSDQDAFFPMVIAGWKRKRVSGGGAGVELAHAAGQDTLFRSLVAIYKAMGGGWVDLAEAPIEVRPEKEAGFIP